MQRSVWSNYCKVMWKELISQLTTETLSYTNLTWVYLGATSGAKTSVFCDYILGQLDSLFTMALMKQLSCISQEAIYREIKVPGKSHFQGSWISPEVTFHGKSFFGKPHSQEVTFTGKSHFPGSIISQWGVKMDFWGIPGSKYDFARNASNFFYSKPLT